MEVKIFIPEAPGVNFINILRAAFATEDPERAKKTIKSSVFLAKSFLKKRR